MTDVQLFGDDEQRKLAKEIISEIERTSKSDSRRLLVVVRRDLRKLNLPAASEEPTDILHFRVTEPPRRSRADTSGPV